jgi:phosphate transport system substrate-binding protein
VEPTEANIRNGSYPITSTVYAIRLKGNDNPNVLALLDWIQSPQGTELVEKSGYTPWEG